MKKIYGFKNDKKIDNIISFLKNYNDDEIIIRQTYVKGSFDDIRIDVCSLGFTVYEDNRPDLFGQSNFNEVYNFVRK